MTAFLDQARAFDFNQNFSSQEGSQEAGADKTTINVLDVKFKDSTATITLDKKSYRIPTERRNGLRDISKRNYGLIICIKEISERLNKMKNTLTTLDSHMTLF